MEAGAAPSTLKKQSYKGLFDGKGSLSISGDVGSLIVGPGPVSVTWRLFDIVFLCFNSDFSVFFNSTKLFSEDRETIDRRIYFFYYIDKIKKVAHPTPTSPLRESVCK
jgi:hypothetical protein